MLSRYSDNAFRIDAHYAKDGTRADHWSPSDGRAVGRFGSLAFPRAAEDLRPSASMLARAADWPGLSHFLDRSVRLSTPS